MIYAMSRANYMVMPTYRQITRLMYAYSLAGLAGTVVGADGSCCLSLLGMLLGAERGASAGSGRDTAGALAAAPPASAVAAHTVTCEPARDWKFFQSTLA